MNRAADFARNVRCAAPGGAPLDSNAQRVAEPVPTCADPHEILSALSLTRFAAARLCPGLPAFVRASRAAAEAARAVRPGAVKYLCDIGDKNVAIAIH